MSTSVDLVKLEHRLPSNYQTMVGRIIDRYPVIAKASRNFNKRQSQFMNNMLTLSQPTELRSLRQILAEVRNSKMALDEGFYKIRKKEVRIKKKRKQLKTEEDPLERELLEIQIGELETQISNTMEYVEGAIRRIASFMDQYDTILADLEIDEVTEEVFEEDEERYHIMKMFEQALCAARAHGGVVDEGNHIYGYQIGISGAAVQIEVTNLLKAEAARLEAGEMPTHQLTWDLMHAMAEKYKGSARNFAERKHMKLLDKESLHCS